ncbi:MAG: hypothetical protein HYZ42_05260, partial [Bacteroidetes bacterium]|nr:hypothetical protein [Bacteroidota bacterium]
MDIWWYSAKPNGRIGANMVIDTALNIYVMAGADTLEVRNDIWKYESATGKWTWLNGDSSSSFGHGNYGIKGTFAASNQPAIREHFSAWIDANGYIWLFGGLGYAQAASLGTLNDLWKYNPTTNLWVWVSGDSTVTRYANYGSQGTESSTNLPGSRWGAANWTDDQGNFCIYGGYGYGQTSNYGSLGDFWKYNLTSGFWTWIAGDSTGGFNPRWGTKGVFSSTNNPGARVWPTVVKDKSGNFILYGGDSKADIWLFSKTQNQWAWIGGDSVSGASSFSTGGAIYGTKNVFTSTNRPGYRQSHTSILSPDGNSMIVFAGTGRACGGCSSGMLNDVWKLSLDTCGAVSGNATASKYTYCGNDTISLFISSYNGTLQWQKNTGSGWSNIGSTNTNPYNGVSISTSTSYRAFITNSCRNDSSNTLSINSGTGISKGNVTVSATNVCPGNTVNLQLSSYSGGTLQWQANTGSGWSNIGSTNTNPLNNVSVSTTTNYRAYIYNSCGSDSTTAIQVVSGSPLTNNTLPSQANNGCNSSSFTITGSIPSGGVEGINQDFTGLTSGVVSTNTLPSNWSLVSSSIANYMIAGNVNSYGRSGNGAIQADNYNIAAGNSAVIETKTFGPTIYGDSLRFDIAYASYNGGTSSQYIDTLRIYADSGAGFILVKQFVGSKTIDTSSNGITTANAPTSSFTPSSSQWTKKSIKLPTKSQRVRFVFTSAYGNNMYIDRVTVDSVQYKWVSSTTSSSSGYSVASGVNYKVDYSGTPISSPIWYKRIAYSGVCGIDTSNATLVSNSSAVLYVDSSVAASGNGSSWAMAYKTLQEALRAAEACSTVDSIRVAKGTYTPDNSKDSSFYLVNGVVLEGGYPTGGGTRNINTNLAILDGKVGNDSARYHVVISSDCDSTTIIDGFIIQNGRANTGGYTNRNGKSYFNAYGGGMLITTGYALSNPQILNCTFKNDSGGTATYGGGAVATTSSSYYENRPSFINCNFIANSGANGGAIYNDATVGVTKTVFINCLFKQNKAGRAPYANDGGAIYSYMSHQNELMAPIMINCVFDQNSSTNGGGAISVSAYGSSTSSARGLYKPTITNCIFKNNSSPSFGGAIHWSSFYFENQAVITNTVFYNNRSVFAGAIRATASSPSNAKQSLVFNNCTFFRNSGSNSETLDIQDSASNINNDHATFNNCIIWQGSNTTTSAPGLKDVNSQINLNNCIYQKDTAGYHISINGTFFSKEYPNFVDSSSASLDMQLKATSSSAINKGDSNLYTATGTSDLSGNNRIQSSNIDLGAYESSYATCANSIGTISASAAHTCDTNSISLNISAYTGTLNWQKNTGSGWTNFGTTNTNPLTQVALTNTTYYRAYISSACSFDTSNIIGVIHSDKVSSNTVPNSLLACPSSSFKITGSVPSGGAEGINEDFTGMTSGSISVTAVLPTNWNLTSSTSTTLLQAKDLNSYSRSGGNGAIMANFYNVTAGNSALMQSKYFGPTIQGDSLKFDIAYSSYNSGTASQYIDTLRVYADSGAGFVMIKQYIGSKTLDTSDNGITTANATTTTFTPSSNQWITKKLNLPVGSKMVRFEFVSAFGNNLYIDRVVVDSFLYKWQSSTTSATSGFVNSSGNNSEINYTSTTPTQPTWYRRIAFSGNCGIDTSNTTIVTTYPSVLYVDSSVSSSGDGSSWSLAFKTLQEALSTAKKCDGIDTVRVAKGTYSPDNNRDSSFVLVTGLVLEGGYPNGGGNRSVNNLTFLDGNVAAGRVYHVLVGIGLDSNTVVDGFIIQNGTANGTGNVFFNGQGIYRGFGGGFYHTVNISAGIPSKPIIKNCVFRDDSTMFGFGGAVFNQGYNYDCNPTFMNCYFVNNVGGSGGAISNNAITGGNCSPIITNCKFIGNNSGSSSMGSGAAIFNQPDRATCSPIITNCEFLDNWCGTGGAAISVNGTGFNYNTNISSPIITNCKFKNNLAGNQGGAINFATQNTISYPVVSNCEFYGNASSIGGAVFVQGFRSQAKPIFNNCTFFRNKGYQGDIIYATDSAGNPQNNFTTLNNCILWQGNDISYLQPGLREYNSKFILKNCVFEQDTNLYNIQTQGTYFSRTYPEFVDTNASSLDLRLTQYSLSAINRGDSSLFASTNTVDLNGNTRIQKGQIDLGCYESSYDQCVAANTGTASASASSVCLGGSINLSITSYVGNLQWQANTGSGWTNIGAANTNPLNNVSPNTATDYRAYITGTCNTDSSNQVSISINTATAVGTASASASAVCAGGSIDLSLTSYAGTLQWQADTGSGWMNIGSANTNPLNNVTVSRATNYRAYITGTCNNDSSNQLSITLKPAISNSGIYAIVDMV